MLTDAFGGTDWREEAEVVEAVVGGHVVGRWTGVGNGANRAEEERCIGFVLCTRGVGSAVDREGLLAVEVDTEHFRVVGDGDEDEGSEEEAAWRREDERVSKLVVVFCKLVVVAPTALHEVQACLATTVAGMLCLCRQGSGSRGVRTALACHF